VVRAAPWLAGDTDPIFILIYLLFIYFYFYILFCRLAEPRLPGRHQVKSPADVNWRWLICWGGGSQESLPMARH
jgi:hypothetical protein